MEFRVSKEELHKAIKISTSTVSEAAKDSSSLILFKVRDDNCITLSSSFGKVFSQTPLYACVEGDHYNFTVQVKRLKSWLSSCDEEDLFFHFNDETKILKATCSLGSIEFESTDPNAFPDWEYLRPAAQKMENVKVDNLISAVSYIKNFLYKDETLKPQYCIAESSDGYLFGTDLSSVVSIKMDGLTSNSLRIHGKTSGPLTKFLGHYKGEMVSIFNHDKAYFLTMADGSVFGEMKTPREYDGPKMKEVDPDQIWSFSKASFNRAIKFLWSGADWAQDEIAIYPDGDQLILGVRGSNKKEVRTKIPFKLKKSSDTSFDRIPVRKSKLERIISLYPKDEIDLGLISKGERKNFLLFDFERQNLEDDDSAQDRYMNMMLCKK
jgi:hypothetical protein